MHILFLTRLFYPHIGGVEKHVYELSKELIKLGHTITILTESLPHTPSNEELEGITIVRIDVGSNEKEKKFRIWKWLLKNKEYIENADIVHCHDVFFWYVPFRFLYPHKKVFTTFHGYETICPPRIQAKIVRKVSEILSNGNICIGKFIEKWYGTKADNISYGGVSKDELTKEEYKENNKINILFLGRLEQDTGLLIYLKMLDILKQKEVTYTFIACGDGSLRKHAEAYGQVLGFVSNVIPYIDKADIVCTSSYLSILQSFARKRLVISTYDNPLKRDYLTHTPFNEAQIIETNPEALADQVISLEQNKEVYFEKIQKGYDYVEKHTWNDVCHDYLELWEKQH